MKPALVLRTIGFALALVGWCVAAAAAQNAPASGQTPPPATVSGQTPPPAAPNDCISANESFKMRGKTPVFEVALENKCERRFRCRIDVYVTSAKGVSQGSGSLLLAPALGGAKAKKAFTLKVKMDSGSAQVSRNCRAG
jgi:hypothetical protein